MSLKEISSSKILNSELNAINSEIALVLSKFENTKLKEAALFSCVENSGKRIRPILFLETLKLFDKPTKEYLHIAAAIEICHVYSLIHDDLPALDNDDYRRGKPSCHKQFNEATAILTGDALLTYCFEVISSNKVISAEKRCLLMEKFAHSIGQNGMLGGQMLDIESDDSTSSTESIIKLHTLKTGRLIEFCFDSACILSDATDVQKNAMKQFAQNFGLIFQITDDKLDYTESNKSEVNIVNTLGQAKTEELLEELYDKAILSLDIFGEKASILKSLLTFVLHRKN